MSRGMDMFRVIGGSLSTIMSTDVRLNGLGWSTGQKHTLIVVLHALLNGVGRFPKYGSPYLGMDGHEGGEKLYLSLWSLRGGLCSPRI